MFFQWNSNWNTNHYFHSFRVFTFYLFQLNLCLPCAPLSMVPNHANTPFCYILLISVTINLKASVVLFTLTVIGWKLSELLRLCSRTFVYLPRERELGERCSIGVVFVIRSAIGRPPLDMSLHIVLPLLPHLVASVGSGVSPDLKVHCSITLVDVRQRS